MIKAVIFDLDGTLLYTLKGLSNACNMALEKMGLPPIKTNSYKYLVGCGADKLMEGMLRTVKHKAEEEDIAKLKEYFNQSYSENLFYKTKPYYGIDRMLDNLKKQGLKLGVFSNKPDEYTQLLISALLPDRFDAVRGKKEDTPRKPDPAGALYIAKELGAEPADCLYIGDSGVDMQTAKNAGMLPMGVLWGFRERKELLSQGARFLAERPEDIITLITVMG